MINARQILDQLMQTVQGMTTSDTSSSQQQTGGLGGLLSNPTIAGAGGVLAGLLLGKRNVGGNLATIGGAAALGTIAYKAYRSWLANKEASTGVPAQNFQQQLPGQQSQPAALNFDNLSSAQQEDHSRAMLTAIIAAAKADGIFDERERQIIHEQTGKVGDAETAAWVQQELYKPLDVNRVAALATSPEMAAEIYLASLFVIDEQNELEKKYLNSLAEKMGLEPQLRKEIERQFVHSSL